jgi:hypothetical protein
VSRKDTIESRVRIDVKKALDQWGVLRAYSDEDEDQILDEVVEAVMHHVDPLL